MMFLEQDYLNKELIIMNDCSDQVFKVNFPNVRIINSQVRYPTLGEKRNAMIEEARGEHIAVWDDDDVYFPWRLSYSVREMKRLATPFFVPAEFWAYWGNERFHDNQAIRGWISHPMFVFRKELWRAAGRYPAQTFGEDAVLAQRMLETIGQDWPSYAIARYDRVFVMRGISKYHHTSIDGGQCPPDTTPGEIVLEPRCIADPVLREVVESLIEIRSITMR
jgi:glycosyltransferase involved in cell wall biosynthesis